MQNIKLSDLPKDILKTEINTDFDLKVILYKIEIHLLNKEIANLKSIINSK